MFLEKCVFWAPAKTRAEVKATLLFTLKQTEYDATLEQ